MQSGQPYQEISRIVSEALDSNINAAVAAAQSNTSSSSSLSSSSSNTAATGTKDELLLEEAARGITMLLQRWPDQHRCIYTCVNRALPIHLRSRVWSLMLAQPAPAPDATTRDVALVQRVETLLAARDTLVALRRVEIVQLIVASACKAVKSGTPSSSMREGDLLLCIPLVFVFSRSPPWTSSGGGGGGGGGGGSRSGVGGGSSLMLDSVSVNIGGCLAKLLENKPKALQHAEHYAQLVTSVLTLIQSTDPSLNAVIQTAFGADEGGAKKSFGKMLYPLVESLFVGHVSMDVVCYLWDQMVIGLSAVKFDWLPYFVAAIVLSLKELLTPCKTVS